MTAPLPSPRPAQEAVDFVDSLMRLVIARCEERVSDLEPRLVDALKVNIALHRAEAARQVARLERIYELRTARNFADTERSGYVHRTHWEAP